jgi:hypothetical protein
MMHLGLILADLYFDTRDRTYLITLKFCSYKHEIKRSNPLSADLEGRGILFRELRNNLVDRFPQLRYLFRDKYSYDNIYIASDFSDRHRNRRPQNDPARSLLRELAHNPSTRMRWKYGDPRFQELLERFEHDRQISRRSIYSILSLYSILIPSEDGIFLALLPLIGINFQTATLFALFFGFAHFWRYSTLNCLRIAFSAILTIVFILPKYGLLTCIVGHILYDLFCWSNAIYFLVQKTHRSVFKFQVG